MKVVMLTTLVFALCLAVNGQLNLADLLNAANNAANNAGNGQGQGGVPKVAQAQYSSPSVRGYSTCSADGDCKSATKYLHFNDDNKWEQKDGGEQKCCIQSDKSGAQGSCYDENTAKCDETGDDASWGVDGGGQKFQNALCADYEGECGAQCYNKATQKCVSKSPHYKDSNYKHFKAVTNTLNGPAGMRIVWIPLAGFLASIILMIVVIIKRKEGLMAEKPLLVKMALGIVLNMFMFLGDDGAPAFAFTLLFGFMLAGVAGTSGNGNFINVALLLNFLIFFNAIGFRFGGDGGGSLMDEARGGWSGCSGGAFGDHFTKEVFDNQKTNPMSRNWGLCSGEWIAFSYFIAWLDVVVFVAITLHLAIVAGKK